MQDDFFKPTILDKIICAISYLTAGTAGVIWLVIIFLMKKPLKPFVQYHVSQAVIFFLILYILNLLFSTIISLLLPVPYIGEIVRNILIFFTTPVHATFSVIQAFITFIIIYMALGALIGSYSYIPYLSDILRRR